MQVNEIKIGAVYRCKVGRNNIKVKIIAADEKGGWQVESVASGKIIIVRNADRLHIPPVVVTMNKAGDTVCLETKRDTAEPCGDTAKVKPLSLINAAAIVLKASDKPLSTKEIIAKAIDANVWQPGKGKTPANTLYASIIKEIKVKGDASRFRKVERGRFALAQ